MMFSNRNNKLCARPAEKIGPMVEIELFSGELGNEILVPKRALFTIRFQMMLLFKRVFLVHIAWIPLVFQLDLYEHADQRFLIATHGEGNWVYNLRAAGKGSLSLSRSPNIIISGRH
jgi:hypothetical protein